MCLRSHRQVFHKAPIPIRTGQKKGTVSRNLNVGTKRLVTGQVLKAHAHKIMRRCFKGGHRCNRQMHEQVSLTTLPYSFEKVFIQRLNYSVTNHLVDSIIFAVLCTESEAIKNYAISVLCCLSLYVIINQLLIIHITALDCRK